MIQKIELIKNIGNYENYVATGDVTLKKMNLIYAENGAGKTTLARILYSLGTNDSTAITQRKRINADTEPEVYIKDANHQFKFNNLRWNRNNNNISVFDTYFVSENIYTGFQIGSDQRKHLYKFVLGNTGVEIANKIERVKKLIENKNDEIEHLAKCIQIKSKCNDIDRFFKLNEIENIDNLIESKSKELAIAQNSNIILKQPLLPSFPYCPINIDTENLKRVLSISINSIGKEYIDNVKSHINNLESNGIKRSAQWIYTGFQAMKTFENKVCPFCGNSIEGIKLIEGYNQFFSERYINAVREIYTFKEQFAKINLDLYISQYSNAKKQFEDNYKFWYNYITINIEKDNIDYNFETLRDYIKSLKNAIDVKYTNPMENVSTIVVDNFVTELKSLSEKIKSINDYVTLYNSKILDLRAHIKKLEDVKKELSELEMNKIRFSAPLKRDCSIYEINTNHLKKLNRINKNYQIEQKAESNRIFDQYGEKINHYLSDVFHTKFKIEEIKDGGIKGRSKESSLSYKLMFDETEIEPEGEDNTSFKNILSEGDKNTIAFSFFLAKLATDTDISNRIVVFDDPLTSLDLNRRNATIHQLVLLYQKCDHVIVLSHNLHFLMELNSQTLIKKAEKKNLQIVNANGKSSIHEHQIKKDWIDNYQKALETMENFLNNPSTDNQEDAINSIRISLETFLKLKYCRFIPDPEQTFGTIVQKLKSSNCVFINPNKDEVIDKLNQLVAISWRGHHGIVEERDVYHEVNITMSEAELYVNMTLNLLNHEL